MLRASRSAFRLSHSVLAACLVLFSALIATAQPVNDRCAGAIEIRGAGPFPTNTPPVILDGATTVGDPPLPPPETQFATNITHSVWYKFTPADSGLYTISTGLDTETSPYYSAPFFKDTSMVMYTSTNDCANFTLFAYNEDSGLLRAVISTNLNAGTTYYIVVWVGGTAVFDPSWELQLRMTKPAVPANDTCASPFVISATNSFPYLTPVVDTTLATTTPNLIHQCVTNIGTMPSREVWYQFTPAATRTYIFSTGAETATRIEDTSIELYTLTGGNCSSPSQVFCNDNSFGRAGFSYLLTNGITYHLAVYDNAPKYVPGETDLQLRVALPTAPTVVTLPPSSITSTNVLLNGTLNANGDRARYWFEWGPTTSLGSTSQVKIILETTMTFTTNLTVSGFQPNTLYTYRMVATNTLGRSEGALRTFAFSNAPPQITTFGFESPNSRTFLVDFAGAASHLYVIDHSTNLVHWTNTFLINGTSGPTNGPIQKATESSPGYFNYRSDHYEPQLFYRVRQP